MLCKEGERITKLLECFAQRQKTRSIVILRWLETVSNTFQNFRKFKVALNPLRRIFLQKVASYHVNYNSVIKMAVTELVFA